MLLFSVVGKREILAYSRKEEKHAHKAQCGSLAICLAVQSVGIVAVVGIEKSGIKIVIASTRIEHAVFPRKTIQREDPQSNAQNLTFKAVPLIRCLCPCCRSMCVCTVYIFIFVYIRFFE